MSLLSVTNLGKLVNTTFIIKGISFQQSATQRIALAGETGSGKSTLLKMIAGLVQADNGEVLFENERVRGPQETLVSGHSGIAYLSQLFELPKFLRVEQVLEYANTLSEKQANKLFKICRIQHLLTRKTDELSGGERQRIALARQLLMQPRLLLLDEPYSNLDIIHKNLLKSVIDEVMTQMKITCILVSHDPLDVLSWADEILVLRKGRCMQQGTAQTVYEQPVDEYVAGLFGKYTHVPTAYAKKLTGMKIKSPLLLRPERFKLKRKSNEGLKGIVSGVRFYGSYHEVDVLVDDLTFFIQTTKASVKVGDAVVVTLS
jgi:ABC-type sugar transport system ATPase subunit